MWIVWASIPAPTDLDAMDLGVAAGVAELLAGRAGQAPPTWPSAVEAAPTPVLRCRGILAPPEFLTVA